jgi:hypothetical protein
MLHMALRCGRSAARRGQATAWAAAEAEQRRVLAERGAGIDIDALGDMDALQRCVTEALRLFPPLIMLLRQAKAAFAVETSAGRRHVVPRARPCLGRPGLNHVVSCGWTRCGVWPRAQPGGPETWLSRMDAKCALDFWTGPPTST